MNEYEAIVRELAERGPLVDEYSECVYCGFFVTYGRSDTAGSPAPGATFNDPANHQPSCLWRRARALMVPA
jgi:hypothetical protein